MSSSVLLSPTAMTERKWSEQQLAIFAWFETGIANGVEAKNLVIRARAGTGKTTTVVRGVGFAPEKRIVFCAFNKRNAEELSTILKQVNPNAEGKTAHAIGYGCVQRFWSGMRLEKTSGERATSLTEKVCGATAPDQIKKLVTKLHSKGREIAPHARNFGDLTDIAYTFECLPDEMWEASRFNAKYVEEKALEAMELAASVKPMSIDFADMIFLPVRNGWTFPTWDLVVIDEAQDWTTAQLELLRGMCAGRMAIVGDDRQAIYAFRGADATSLDRLKAELNAVELGLTTTYRCGQIIVELAKTLVPDYRADEGNPEGEILTTQFDKLVAEVELGDFVLSRTNAPLVSVAMSLLRFGKRARIAGRDIGSGLKALIRQFAKGSAAHSIPQLITRINAWEARQVVRHTAAKRDDKVAMVQDQAATLVALAEGATSVRDVESRIDALFTDDGLGQLGVITCSSVHRAKGLESKRVFILRDTLKAHNQEELNITYVAVTRAMQTLVWVD